MRPSGVRQQPGGWGSVVAGIGAVLVLAAAVALVGLVLAAVADLLLT